MQHLPFVFRSKSLPVAFMKQKHLMGRPTELLWKRKARTTLNHAEWDRWVLYCSSHQYGHRSQETQRVLALRSLQIPPGRKTIPWRGHWEGKAKGLAFPSLLGIRGFPQGCRGRKETMQRYPAFTGAGGGGWLKAWSWQLDFKAKNHQEKHNCSQGLYCFNFDFKKPLWK